MQHRLAKSALVLGVTLLAAEVRAAPGASALAAPSLAPSLAMLPLVASGLAADEIGPIEATVRAAAERHFGARMLPAKQVIERLERGGATGLRCDRLDPSCSAQLGAVCGVGEVLVASLSANADESRLDLRLFDVAEVAQLAHAAGTVSGTVHPDDVLAVLRALAEPAASSTSVMVHGAAGSLLVVDGEDRGALPMLEPLTSLAPGPHEIGVDGPVSFRQTIELRRGEPLVLEGPGARAAPAPKATVASARLPGNAAPAPSGGLAPPLVAVIGGSTAAALGAAAIVAGFAPLIIANQGADRLAEREARAKLDPSVIDTEASLIREDHESVVASNAAWRSWGGLATIVGGAVMVAGAVVVAAGVSMWAE